ncbi:MAG: hypothetical protein U9N32_03930, partial [Spirochaetota bacterium]|nr:hypothetical protein [Spirochaetota bacterium]
YINQLDSLADPIYTLGLRQIVARGFYKTRPYVGVEIPFGSGLDINPFLDFFFIPVNFYIGTELNWYLGRLHITPAVDVAMGMLIPIIEEWQDDWDIMSSLGGHARLGISYMFTDNMKLFGEVGYSAMLSLLGEEYFSSYSGILYGGGVTFKY